MLSDLINCKECGQIFLSRNGQTLCSVCSRREDQIFDIVRKYVRTHPGQNVWEVSEGTGVRLEILLNMVKRGSLAQVN